jgi:hypothetical protein
MIDAEPGWFDHCRPGCEWNLAVVPQHREPFEGRMMRFQQLIDVLPITAVFVVFVIFALLAAETGYRLGSWLQSRTPDEKEGPTIMIVGSMLALMAFLQATTMSMSSDRFDTRCMLASNEVIAVSSSYLRADYLPEPASRS